MSNKLLSALLLIPMILINSVAKAECRAECATAVTFAESFSDVKSGNEYYLAINYLKDQKIIQGYDDNTYKSKNTINRAEAIKMILLATGISPDAEIKATEAPFTDTPLDAWYMKYLLKAKEKGMIAGLPNGTFKPGDEITLAEFLKIYLEALKGLENYNIDFGTGVESLFDDTAPDAWFTPYTSYASLHGLINIYANNTVNPEQKMTRGYLAEVIYRQLKSREELEFGKATYYYGIPSKNNDEYDKNLMVTAHKTLPKGTIVEVTDLTNGKSVKVKVTDRGPYGPGRVLDLSKKAFAMLEAPNTGVINIQFKVVEN